MFGQILLDKLFLRFHGNIVLIGSYPLFGVFVPDRHRNVNQLWIMFDFNFHLRLH